MPLPLIPVLIGVGIPTIMYGLKKGYDSKQAFDRAEDITKDAIEIYERAQGRLEATREETSRILEDLGRQKLEVCLPTLHRFVTIFESIKNIDYSDPDLNSPLGSDLGDLAATEDGFTALRNSTLEMADVLGGSAISLAGGMLTGVGAFGTVSLLGTASTGTAISALSGAAATNATLAWFGGGSLASGGLGMAAGTAVLGGIVAAPVLLIGGLLLSSKAESAVSGAYSNLDEARTAAKSLEEARTAANAIRRRAEQVVDVLEQLGTPFEDHVDDLAELVERNVDYATYSQREQQKVGASFALARMVKNVMDAPIFDNEGKVTRESKRILDDARKALPKLARI